MRFKEEDIIFDDGINTGNVEEEISAYIWATDTLVSLTDYNKVRRSETDYINFYPIYNTITTKFIIKVSYTDGKTFNLKLHEDEEKFIFDKFKLYIESVCDGSFEVVVRSWNEL